MSSRFRVPKLTNSKVVIRIAKNSREIDAANWLVFRNYVAEGYWENDVHQRLVQNPWLSTSHREIFVAICNEEIVGTASLIHDSDSGLPSDSFQPNWMEYFRRSGDCLAEISALAVEKNRPDLKNLSLFLMKYYMQYSFYYTKTDRLIKACRPNHADFYAHVLRFERNGDVVYNKYARRYAQLLSIDMIDSHRVLSDYYEHDELKRKNFYRFLMIDEHPSTTFPDTNTAVRPRQRDWVAVAHQHRAAEQPRSGTEVERRRGLVTRLAVGA